MIPSITLSLGTTIVIIIFYDAVFHITERKSKQLKFNLYWNGIIFCMLYPHSISMYKYSTIYTHTDI